ncbi:MAG: SUMF1/EgtB/PvdO family nonheme iron enzyme [bacterium]
MMIHIIAICILCSLAMNGSHAETKFPPAKFPPQGGMTARKAPHGVDDFNLDVKSDFFWRNYSTGINAGWLMDNRSYLGPLSLPKVTEDMNWIYSGMGDFNADNKPDLVWRHYGNGKNAVWFMDGETCTGSAYMPPATDTQWVLSGVEDMNQDSHPDLIWRHYGTGQNVIWYMNGTVCTGSANLPGSADLSWRIAGVRDFDGDARPDLLWRNYSTGQNALWYMNNAALTGTSWLMPVTDLNWIIASVNDHDKDGACDIVWRHYTTGKNRVWYMNNASYLGYGDTLPITDLDWRMGTSYLPRLLKKEITIPLDLPEGATPLVLVLIPAGTFMMGSPDDEQDRDVEEGPQHPVSLTHPFYLGKYEVTQAQWQALMGTNPASFTGDNHPVELVSWNDCQAFIQELNELGQGTFRLPTEAEWEYACRARTSTRFFWGDDPTYTQIGQYAWYYDNSGDQTHDVGLKWPNVWRIHDLSGSVYEWCQDWYGTYSSNPQIDPPGPETGEYRVWRGGSWYLSGKYARSAYRYGSVPDYKDDALGFRIALSPDE